MIVVFLNTGRVVLVLIIDMILCLCRTVRFRFLGDVIVISQPLDELLWCGIPQCTVLAPVSPFDTGIKYDPVLHSAALAPYRIIVG